MAEAPEKKDKETEKKPDQVKLEHRHNYIGGPYAYKNSSKAGKRLDPENLTELVLMTKPGIAAKVSIALPDIDKRAGVFPQHNTVVKNVPVDEDETIEFEEDFTKKLELLPSRTLDVYAHLTNTKQLKASGFQKRICSMTKNRLDKIQAQFSHLSTFAFNQMLDITRPDKRDFTVWFKVIKKNNQVIIAYPNEKEKTTNFIQVIQYDEDENILGIRHCTFAENSPLVINETVIDKYNNLRQIAHLGAKGDSNYLNSVERFDDGTVAWIITHEGISGSGVLKTNGEIFFIEDIYNESTKVAIKNLGAEKVDDGKWTGEVDLQACKEIGSAMQEAYKSKVRQQISQIVDGASIPGLDPIFWVKVK
jgi:hypothetical protein